jgi:hypothetical protein
MDTSLKKNTQVIALLFTLHLQINMQFTLTSINVIKIGTMALQNGRFCVNHHRPQNILRVPALTRLTSLLTWRIMARIFAMRHNPPCTIYNTDINFQ